MRSVLIRRLLLVVSVLTLLSGIANAEEFEYIPASQQVYLGIGCQQGTGGTCDSTAYWLGKSPGDGSVANTFNLTPIEWVFRQLGEPTEYARFLPDESLAPSYTLRTDTPITGTIEVSGWATGAEVAADSNVRLLLEAVRVDNGDYLELGDVTINKAVVTPSAATPDSIVYEWTMELDPALDKVAVQDISLALYQDSVTVMGNGFVNGEGGSSFKLPYYDVQPITPTEPTEPTDGGTTTP